MCLEIWLAVHLNYNGSYQEKNFIELPDRITNKREIKNTSCKIKKPMLKQKARYR